MSKLELIKTKLAKLLLQFATIKTDKAVLEYDGEELAVGTEVFITDENGERKPAEEVSEEVVEEVPSEESNDLTERLTALEVKVEELIAIVEKLVEKSETDSNAVEERLSKIEKMSASKTIEEEFEITKTSRKTGDAKMDARIAKATAMSKDWRY